MPVENMPKLNAYIKIKAIDFDFNDVGQIEDGYLTLYLAIKESDSPTNPDFEPVDAIYFRFNVIRDIGLGAGRVAIKWQNSGNAGEYMDFKEFIGNLKLGLKVGGYLSLNAGDAEDYTNTYLNTMLGKILKGVGIKFGLTEFDLDIAFEIKGIVHIGGYDADGNFDVMQNIGKSEVAIELCHRNPEPGEQKLILGIYVKNGNVYLNLSYFGVPSIGITSLDDLINQIKEMTASPEEETPSPSNVVSLLNIDNAANANLFDAPEAVALQLLLYPNKMSLSIGKDALTALLAMLLKSELPVALKDTSLDIYFGETGYGPEVDEFYNDIGFGIGLTTGVEAFDLKLRLGGLRIAADESELMEEFSIEDPETKESAPEDGYYMTNNGMPDNVYLQIGGQATINSTTNKRTKKNLFNLTTMLQ